MDICIIFEKKKLEETKKKAKHSNPSMEYISLLYERKYTHAEYDGIEQIKIKMIIYSNEDR